MTTRDHDRSLTRDSVGRHIGRAPSNDEDMYLLARAAWRDRGYFGVHPNELTNEIDRAYIEGLGDRLYGKRTSP